jgi:endonuclease-3
MTTKKEINWASELQPLIKKYCGRKYPLNYHNNYELLVMVLLRAQDSIKHINQVTPALFKAFPSMGDLAQAKVSELNKLIGMVRNFANKTKWLLTVAKTVRSDANIPTTLEGLTALPGIGRMSANIIIREIGGKAEGIIVDLHALRVVPRLGIESVTDPKKVESRLMIEIPQKDWNEIGMSLSMLGQEICRPTNPMCPECLLNNICDFYAQEKKPK